MNLAIGVRRQSDDLEKDNTVVSYKAKPAIDPNAARTATAAVVRAEPQPAPPPAVAPTLEASEESLVLLDKGTKCLLSLLTRNKQLEEHVHQLDAWSTAQVQAAEAAAVNWKTAAEDSDRKLQDLQRELSWLRTRAEEAEQTLERERRTLTVIQDRIINAFGFGSEAHDAVQAY